MSRSSGGMLVFVSGLALGALVGGGAIMAARPSHKAETVTVADAAQAEAKNLPKNETNAVSGSQSGQSVEAAAAVATTAQPAVTTVANAAPATAPAVQPAANGAAVAPVTEAATGDIYAPFIGVKFTRGPAMAGKKIALTFDDGPSPMLTPEVLRILKSEGAKATFFMLGKEVAQYPEVAKLVADAGHEIGCHSFGHKDPAKINEAIILEEINSANELIENATGSKPRLYRPPYGSVNSRVVAACKQTGMVIVHWSVDPKDWKPSSTPESVMRSTTGGAHSGSIVCVHDIHKRTVAALPTILKTLKAKGYQFCTVSELVADAAKHKTEMMALGAGGVAGGGMEQMDGASPAMKPAAISLNQSTAK